MYNEWDEIIDIIQSSCLIKYSPSFIFDKNTFKSYKIFNTLSYGVVIISLNIFDTLCGELGEKYDETFRLEIENYIKLIYKYNDNEK